MTTDDSQIGKRVTVIKMPSFYVENHTGKAGTIIKKSSPFWTVLLDSDGTEHNFYPSELHWHEDDVLDSNHTPTTTDTTEGDTPMVSISEAQKQVEALESELAEAKRVLERAKITPEEPPEGTVISFYLRYRPSDSQHYTYAAVRCGDLWYATSQSRKKAMTWDELLAWYHAAYFHGPLVIHAPVTLLSKAAHRN